VHHFEKTKLPEVQVLFNVCASHLLITVTLLFLSQSLRNALLRCPKQHIWGRVCGHTWQGTTQCLVETEHFYRT